MNFFDVGYGILRETTPDGDSAVIAVSDPGIGIPDEAQPHVFDRFFRASNVQASMPGAGLGLTGAGVNVAHMVCRRIIVLNAWVRREFGSPTRSAEALRYASLRRRRRGCAHQA